MADNAATYPIPLNAPSRRLEAIDILRGLLMILMAIDHARDYFSSVGGVDLTDPVHSWPALFATRWITHICAPGFIALAGASVYLQRQRGKSIAQIVKLLLTRGLWLMFLEITLISFGWSFFPVPVLQVIWAIGVSMIFLALLQGLPPVIIGGIGAAIVMLHNLLDRFDYPGLFGTPAWWLLLHERGALTAHGHRIGLSAYPILPWIGVICLGYAFGPLVLKTPAIRQRLSVLLATALFAAFTILRVFNGYGDNHRFQHLDSTGQTAMSFLQVQKYPPSLDYLLATLGVVLLLYAFFDAITERNLIAPVRHFIETYGRVPFFYYILHIYILHSIALALTAEHHLDWRFWLKPASVFIGHLDGWGYNLPGVYLVWALVVLALYYPCRWFGGVKARRRDWWLSYL